MLYLSVMGFIINIDTLMLMIPELLQRQRYICTYRCSQVHLELLFNSIRASDMSALRCFWASANRHVAPRRLTVDRVFTGLSRAASGAAKDKKPLKKAKTPQGQFDNPEETSKDILEKFPDDVNPVTKEKGGPRGPEPTRYGDWERKGRCIDF